MTLGKAGSSAKIQYAQYTQGVVNEEFRRHKYSRVISKVAKIWKYFETSLIFMQSKKINKDTK